MDPQPRIPIPPHDRKGRIARPGTDLQHHLAPRAGPRDLVEDGEFLEEPVPVFEEGGGFLAVEEVPPSGWVGVEAGGVEGGDGVEALVGVLGEAVGGVGGGREGVVPGVEGVGVGVGG